MNGKTPFYIYLNTLCAYLTRIRIWETGVFDSWSHCPVSIESKNTVNSLFGEPVCSKKRKVDYNHCTEKQGYIFCLCILVLDYYYSTEKKLLICDKQLCVCAFVEVCIRVSVCVCVCVHYWVECVLLCEYMCLFVYTGIIHKATLWAN